MICEKSDEVFASPGTGYMEKKQILDAVKLLVENEAGKTNSETKASAKNEAGISVTQDYEDDKQQALNALCHHVGIEPEYLEAEALQRFAQNRERSRDVDVTAELVDGELLLLPLHTAADVVTVSRIVEVLRAMIACKLNEI